jgi:uncharacterized protein involved in outer membrane biogenesis
MKIFISTLTGLIVIIILIAVIVGFVFWSRVPDMLANNLSKKMRVPVSIDSMGLGWGKIDIKKIDIGNPPQSILAKAFSCNEIDVHAPFTHYLNQRVVIDEIDLNDLYLGLEFDSASSTKGNWTTIMNNLNSSTAVGQKSEKKASRSVLIHRLVLTNIDVDVVYKKDGGKVKKLPTIPRVELTEISSEGGLPMDQVMNSVLGEMLKQVFIKENLKNMLQELMNQPGPIQQYLSPFKGLFGEAEEEAAGQ